MRSWRHEAGGCFALSTAQSRLQRPAYRSISSVRIPCPATCGHCGHAECALPVQPSSTVGGGQRGRALRHPRNGARNIPVIPKQKGRLCIKGHAGARAMNTMQELH